MIDIETWGTENDAVIVSLGAVKFDLHVASKDIISDSFYVAIDPQSCMAYKLSVSANTLKWWMDPARDKPRNDWIESEKVDLATALDGFSQWYGTRSLPTWGNGATFDNIIMRSAFKAVGMELPWDFWDDRCYRTFKNLAPEIKLVRKGDHHNALDDAISQAKHMQEITDHLGIHL
jgi:exodeoxyribonuclease VIII